MAMCDDPVEKMKTTKTHFDEPQLFHSLAPQNVESNAWPFKVEMKFIKGRKFYYVINLSKMCIGKQDVR